MWRLDLARGVIKKGIQLKSGAMPVAVSSYHAQSNLAVTVLKGWEDLFERNKPEDLPVTFV